jgi:hypothetical protein
MSEEDVFPLLDQSRTYRKMSESPYPKGVPWAFIAPHAEAAMANHGQTLNRLASRGGLSPQEMFAVVQGWPFRQLVAAKMSQEDAIERLRVKLKEAGLAFVERP